MKGGKSAMVRWIILNASIFGVVQRVSLWMRWNTLCQVEDEV